MKHRSIYVIRPKKPLLALLRERYADLEDLFGGVVWSKDEGGKTIWRPADYMTQVKATFLGDIWTDLTSSEDVRLSLLAKELLGSPPLHVTSFDRWWHLDRYVDFDEDFSSVVERVARHANVIAPTGSKLVDEWLREVTTSH